VLLLALVATLAATAPDGTLTELGPSGVVHQLGPGSAAAWSPDGLRLAFVRGGDVWTIDAAGGVGREVTTDGAASSPVWSPDGTRLAWVDGGLLVVAASDGSAPTTLADGLTAAPAWSPDGSRIAFERRAGADAALEVVQAGGGVPRRLGFGASTAAPAWQGLTIAYLDNHRLLLWPGARRLAPKLIVTSAPSRHGAAIAVSGPRGIYVVTGTRVRSLGRGVGPVFSTDGARLAFTLGGGLWQMNGDGTCRARIGAYAQPAWAPGPAGRLHC
jgi:WD40-like Beta Propeller Repeat